MSTLSYYMDMCAEYSRQREILCAQITELAYENERLKQQLNGSEPLLDKWERLQGEYEQCRKEVSDYYLEMMNTGKQQAPNKSATDRAMRTVKNWPRWKLEYKLTRFSK